MKLRELTAIIADIRKDADALEFGARTAYYTEGSTKVLTGTFSQSGVIAAVMRILVCCDKLEDLVPDAEVEFRDEGEK